MRSSDQAPTELVLHSDRPVSLAKGRPLRHGHSHGCSHRHSHSHGHGHGHGHATRTARLLHAHIKICGSLSAGSHTHVRVGRWVCAVGLPWAAHLWRIPPRPNKPISPPRCRQWQGRLSLCGCMSPGALCAMAGLAVLCFLALLSFGFLCCLLSFSVGYGWCFFRFLSLFSLSVGPLNLSLLQSAFAPVSALLLPCWLSSSTVLGLRVSLLASKLWSTPPSSAPTRVTRSSLIQHPLTGSNTHRSHPIVAANLRGITSP